MELILDSSSTLGTLIGKRGGSITPIAGVGVTYELELENWRL